MTDETIIPTWPSDVAAIAPHRYPPLTVGALRRFKAEQTRAWANRALGGTTQMAVHQLAQALPQRYTLSLTLEHGQAYISLWDAQEERALLDEELVGLDLAQQINEAIARAAP